MFPGVSPEWVKIDLLNYGRMTYQSKGNLMLINIHIRNTVWKTNVQKILALNQCHVIKQKMSFL